ncbi:MAG: xylose isomerase, partial [Treponema sp.]|nr:xylose isomerase [Treponema sp.]
MSEFFKNIPEIKFEGKESKNPWAFKFYNPDLMLMGKKMSEHLPFAMAWWHNLGANGVDMFGSGTADKSFGQVPGTMEHAKAKVDAGIEFMKKLGIKYYCWHDVDLVPEDPNDINVTNKRLDEISDYILEKTKGTDIKCLWGTA